MERALQDAYEKLTSKLATASNVDVATMRFVDQVTADADMVVRTLLVCRVITQNLDDTLRRDPALVCDDDGGVSVPMRLRAFACVVLARMLHLGRRHCECDVQDLRDMGIQTALTRAIPDVDNGCAAVAGVAAAQHTLEVSKIRLACYQIVTALMDNGSAHTAATAPPAHDVYAFFS